MTGMMKPVKKNKIKKLRLVRGITQQELAEYACMTEGQLQRIEEGKVKVENLSLKTALSLAKALGVEIEEIE